MNKLLGIMTSRIRDPERFQLYWEAARQDGGNDLIIFTPEEMDLTGHRVLGFMFSQNKWENKYAPLPCVIYDIGYYRTLKSKRKARQIKEESGIPFAGDWLDGKWRVHKRLMRSPLLASYLMKTVLFKSASDVLTMLDQHSAVMIKPVYGDSGRGIIRIRQEHGFVYLKENGQPEIRLVQEEIVQTLTAMQAQSEYIVQQWIDTRDADGAVRDFRVLIQKNDKGQWQCTGMIARQGEKGSITSNLETGGLAVDVLPVLHKSFGAEQSAALIRDMRLISLHIARHLEQSYQKRFVEMGIDAAVDPNGQIKIIEVNEKPGKSMMRTGSDDSIFVRSMQLPVQYMARLAEQKGSPTCPWEQQADSIIADGMNYLRTPYLYGAKAWLTERFDCSSFIQFIFGLNGIMLPRNSRQQSTLGIEIAREELRKGDLLFFITEQRKKYPGIRRIGHVGIYLGDNRMLHASRISGVTVSLVDKYNRGIFLKAKRMIVD